MPARAFLCVCPSFCFTHVARAFLTRVFPAAFTASAWRRLVPACIAAPRVPSATVSWQFSASPANSLAWSCVGQDSQAPSHRGTRPGRPLGGSSVVPGSAVSVSLSLTWTFTSYTPGDVHVAFYYPPVKCILFMFHCAVTSIFLYEFRSKGCQNHGLNRL